jgi:hypothetical protein
VEQAAFRHCCFTAFNCPPPDPLPVLKEQARQLLAALQESGDREVFLRLNPFLALLVEAASKRGTGRSA